MAVTAERELVRRAMESVAFFAEVLTGAPLWPHQLDVAESAARYRVICAGRQVGKSRLLALMALHAAFRRPDQLVLIVSAGEVAARRLLDDVAALAQNSPLLRDAVLDDGATVVTLSNGSSIRSVPASQRQIRGWAVDLLIVDEAAFVDPEVWRSAEPAIIARPGSRVVLSSSPFGSATHFFRVLWRRGMSDPDEQVRSWHWPSTTSPLVDAELLEEIRRRESPPYFAREYLAEWTEASGAYFTSAEIEENVADYVLRAPHLGGGQMCVGGIDWGLAHDANALALVGVLDDGNLNRDLHPAEPVFFVPWLEAHHGMAYTAFIDHVLDVGDPARNGFGVEGLVSETNGVGQMPTDSLRQLVWKRGRRTVVVPVHTDARRKESGFGQIKGLLQQGRLVLPRHKELLQQLASLEFEQTDAGNTKISVPERLGHDDVAMALMQAMSAIRPSLGWRPELYRDHRDDLDDLVETARGVRLARHPRCMHLPAAYRWPKGHETGDGW